MTHADAIVLLRQAADAPQFRGGPLGGNHHPRRQTASSASRSRSSDARSSPTRAFEARRAAGWTARARLSRICRPMPVARLSVASAMARRASLPMSPARVSAVANPTLLSAMTPAIDVATSWAIASRPMDKADRHVSITPSVGPPRRRVKSSCMPGDARMAFVAARTSPLASVRRGSVRISCSTVTPLRSTPLWTADALPVRSLGMYVSLGAGAGYRRTASMPRAICRCRCSSTCP